MKARFVSVGIASALVAGCPSMGSLEQLARSIAPAAVATVSPVAQPTVEPGSSPTPAGTDSAGGTVRTLAGSWKAYRMDHSTNPPSSITSTISLREDGTFEMRSGSSYQGGELARMSTAGEGSGTYTLVGDALALKFEDGSDLAGTVAGDNLSLDGRTYYPCSGWAC